MEQANRLGGGCFIVSNSRLNDIQQFTEYHKMDLSLFDGIFVNENFKDNSGKGQIYIDIMEKFNVNPEEIMVIGNSYKHDILPAKRLKMKYFKCKDGFTYEEVVS